MSKLFQALQNAQADSKPPQKPLPLKVPDLTASPTPEKVKADNLPVFTNYDIDEMVEYLLDSYESSPGKTFGILPLNHQDSAAAIVLETFMYLALNCDVRAMLCDLAGNRPMLDLLREAKALDNGQTIPKNTSICHLTVLQQLFDYVLVSRDPAKGSASRRQLAVDLLRYTEPSELSMFLFPSIAGFNPFSIQMARRVDKLILLGAENQSDVVAQAGRFLDKIGAQADGVYLLG